MPLAWDLEFLELLRAGELGFLGGVGAANTLLALKVPAHWEGVKVVLMFSSLLLLLG